MTRWMMSREILRMDEEGRFELGRERFWRLTDRSWFGKRRWVRIPGWLMPYLSKSRVSVE